MNWTNLRGREIAFFFRRQTLLDFREFRFARLDNFKITLDVVLLYNSLTAFGYMWSNTLTLCGLEYCEAENEMLLLTLDFTKLTPKLRAAKYVNVKCAIHFLLIKR